MNPSSYHKPLAHLHSERGTDTGRPMGLSILGATGSIGRQTLDIIAAHPDRFRLVALSTNTRVEEAVHACVRFSPRILVVCDPAAARKARVMLAAAAPAVTVLEGAEGMDVIASLPDVDMVVTATVGYSGLLPTLAAIRSGKDIALANKETLVVAGEYIRREMADSPSRIFPVDSEHSAIAQCLCGEDMEDVNRIVITASGGPFRQTPAHLLQQMTAADALKHPNWSMGAKITVDSATMMNKAFEIVEAHYLFGLPGSAIRPVVHPQSVVHSMVEFKDGALKAQLGVPDMHLPIAYALGMNGRIEGASPYLTLEQMSSLTFHEPDTVRFPCLDFAALALERAGNSACVINAANEVAVEAFLKGAIRFTDFATVIYHALDTVPYVQYPEMEDYVETNTQARTKAAEWIKRNQSITQHI